MSDIEIKQEKFGELDDGREVTLFKIENENGMRVDITNYGGIIVRLYVPDINGELDDVVLGFDNLEQYFDELVHTYEPHYIDPDILLHGNTLKMCVCIKNLCVIFNKYFQKISDYINNRGQNKLLIVDQNGNPKFMVL